MALWRHIILAGVLKIITANDIQTISKGINFPFVPGDFCCPQESHVTECLAYCMYHFSLAAKSSYSLH